MNYLIAYTWDPTADIRGASDILDPGISDITTDGCIGVAFDEPRCSGSTFSLHVFQGATSQLTDSVSFPATAILGLRNNISLNANGGSAGFDSIENDVVVPEPASLLFVAAGLAMLAGRERGRMRKTLRLTLQHFSEFRRPASRRYRGQ